jgi:hypothetical protein
MQHDEKLGTMKLMLYRQGGPNALTVTTSDVLSASRNGSRLLLLLMSRKPLQAASSSITGHQDGDEVSKKIISIA